MNNVADADMAVTATQGSFQADMRGRGGGIYSNLQNLNLDAGSIRFNRATHSGGGVYIRSGASANTPFAATIGGDTVITSNNARYGGGVAIGQGTASAADPMGVHITGAANISNNNAAYGGGIHVNNTHINLLIDDLPRIDHNNAANKGGGIFMAANDPVIPNSQRLDIRDITFIRHNEAADGGGIYISGNMAAVADILRTGEDVLFFNNKAHNGVRNLGMITGITGLPNVRWLNENSLGGIRNTNDTQWGTGVHLINNYDVFLTDFTAPSLGLSANDLEFGTHTLNPIGNVTFIELEDAPDSTPLAAVGFTVANGDVWNNWRVELSAGPLTSGGETLLARSLRAGTASLFNPVSGLPVSQPIWNNMNTPAMASGTDHAVTWGDLDDVSNGIAVQFAANDIIATGRYQATLYWTLVIGP